MFGIVFSGLIGIREPFIKHPEAHGITFPKYEPVASHVAPCRGQNYAALHFVKLSGHMRFSLNLACTDSCFFVYSTYKARTLQARCDCVCTRSFFSQQNNTLYVECIQNCCFCLKMLQCYLAAQLCMSPVLSTLKI